MTNSNPEKFEGKMFQMSYSRVTKKQLGRYLFLSQENVSYYDEDVMEQSAPNSRNSSSSKANNVSWINIEDAILTGSDDLTVYTSSIAKQYIQLELEEDLLFNPELSKLMWENREVFTSLPRKSEVSPYSLYVLTFISMAINPYYWHEGIYNYSNTTGYYQN
jgi:hypothetical protein